MRADSLFNEGLRRARTGDYVPALALLRESLALDADRAETCRLMGKVCLHLGQLDEAEACWERALALEPSDSEAARCLRVLGRHRTLRHAWSAALVLILAAVVTAVSWHHYRSLRGFETALARLETRLQVAAQPQLPEQEAPEPPGAPAAPPAAQPQPEAPAEPVQEPAAPPAPPPIPTRAPAAAPPPSPARAPETSVPFADRYQTALSAALAGELAKARGLFEPLAQEVHAKEPLAGNAHYWLGRCLYELGDTRAALQRFNLVLAQYPRSYKVGDAMLDSGRCHLRLGDPEKAREAWQKLLDGRYEARVKEAARRLMREAGF